MNEFEKIILKRLDIIRTKIKELSLDAILITKRENYMYMSGFTGSSAFLIITSSDALLITDFRYEEQATEQANKYKVIKYDGNVIQELGRQLKALNIDKLGFEDASVTFEQYTEYKNNFETKELIPIGNILEILRACKEQYEIEIIKQAVEIADKAFLKVVNLIKPGMTELEVAAELEYAMKKFGASGASFETIAASGTRSSMPHGVASEKVIEAGDTLTLDYGALYKGYCSDITRTVFIGQPSEEMRKIYNIVLEAQKIAEETTFAGLTGKEIDAAARDYIYKNGYEGKFGHGLGHGVGLEIHEAPRLSPAGNMEMKNGMVVTVEPGIYIPGMGGVRIEDVVVINGNSPIILTKAIKELIVI